MRNTRLALIAAPALTVVYGLLRLLDGLDGARGPGFLWTAAHLSFLAALILFVPVMLTARRMAGGGAVATTFAVAGVIGVICAIAQISIDIVVGITAGDTAEMRQMFGEVREVPGVAFAVYGPGPALFYVGLLALIIHLAVVRAAPVWAPVLIFLGIGAALASLDLLPLAGLLILGSLTPLARRVPAYA